MLESVAVTLLSQPALPLSFAASQRRQNQWSGDQQCGPGVAGRGRRQVVGEDAREHSWVTEVGRRSPGSVGK
jgi:hypothetical protein